jgi:hypothetical protein
MLWCLLQELGVLSLHFQLWDSWKLLLVCPSGGKIVFGKRRSAWKGLKTVWVGSLCICSIELVIECVLWLYQSVWHMELTAPCAKSFVVLVIYQHSPAVPY